MVTRVLAVTGIAMMSVSRNPRPSFMFRSLIRRVFKRDTQPEPVAAPSVQVDRAEQQRLKRQALLEQAIAVAHDEAAAAAFIQQCDYPDARRQAAQHLHNRIYLTQVLQAVRNTDRRVAKLMQQRLDALDQAEAREAQALKAIEQAERLAAAPQLVVSQVTELDHAWRSVGDAPAALRERFDVIRELLRQRLQAQTDLQRSLLDASAELGRLEEATGTEMPADAQQKLDQLQATVATLLQSPEASALPAARVHAFNDQAARLGSALAAHAERQAAIAARTALLDEWEALAQQDAAQLDDAALRLAWQALPALAGGEAPELAARHAALLAAIRQARNPVVAEPPQAGPVAPPEPVADPAEARRAMDAALSALEAALEEGSLQAASEQDKALRAMDFKAIRPGDERMARLSRLRAELARLQGWARWGGNVSREELLKAAQDLADHEMPVAERAQKVGSLRERWKALDASAGPAGKDAWQRFDAACTAAYAPVAEHFRMLAEERRQNLEKAHALTAEVIAHAESTGVAGDPESVDWKAVTAAISRYTQAWQRLGTIERRERKAADADFSKALDLLRKPLSGRHQIEVARREQLIAEVESLDAGAPRATDSLRAIQERWQDYARGLPLPRNEEQALWQRFRQACDALFAERRESAKTADAERQQHLERKEALCASLEAAVDAPAPTLSQLLRDSAAAWREIGPVPRAAQQQIEARYDAAVNALRQRADAARQAASQAQAELLKQKFMLCRRAEQALAEGAMDASRREALRQEWDALPALSGGNERPMAARFAAALEGGESLRAALRQNREAVMQEILQMEIRLGVDSPAALSQERLKQQIQVLQDALRAGQRTDQPQALLKQLCTQPALLDDEAAVRIERLIMRSSEV
jgi:exonuclease SbcC